MVECAANAGKRWRDYLGLIVVTVLVVLFVALFPWLRFRGLMAGLVVGSLGMVLVLSLVRFGAPSSSGHAAEQWSLQSLRKVGGWLITPNLSFEGVDVDHVVVTRTAVLAVETKFRGKPFNADIERARHQRELDAAIRGARKVRLLLQSKKMRDHCDVLPVLIVWGHGRPALARGYRRDGEVYVLDGDHPELWAHLFAAPLLDRQSQLSLHRVIEDYAAVRDGYDAGKLPRLRTEMRSAFWRGVAEAEMERTSRRALRERLARRHATLS